MSYCVPDWDVATGGDLDVVIHSTDLFPSSKGKWELRNRKKSNFSDMILMPDHDFEELYWDNGRLLVVTQSQKQRQWQLANSSSEFSTVSENEDTVLLSSRSKVFEKGGVLEATVHDIAGVAKLPEGSNSIQEDEMASWLHNDEPLEKYCTDLPTDILSSSLQMQKGFNGREAVESGQNNQNLKTGIEGHVDHGGLMGSAVCDSMSKSVNAAMAIEIGSSRVANLPSIAGAEALHISSHPKRPDVIPSKQANGALLSCSTLGISTLSRTRLSKEIPGPASLTVATQMPPPKTQPRSTSVHSSSQPAELGLLNFSHFSRPAAIVKANLQAIGMASLSTGVERLIPLDRVHVEACMSADSSIESTTTGITTLCGQMDGTAHSGAAGDPQNANITSSLQPLQSLSTTKQAIPATCVDKAVEPSNVQNSFATSNVVLGIQKGKVIEAPDPTVSSSGGGSAGNSAGKRRKVAVRSSEKRKHQYFEDLECQSEDPEDESADVRKPPATRTPSTKRSRAAEIHNLSERRRRDKINEKMRALQELIPNSNKTDKASLLEEAIEYLKMLQTQIQLMSFRSGISVSPVLMPPGTQHLQMSQVSSFPHIGVGIGMGMGAGMSMGMGFGMMDMSTSTQARHALPFPSFPGSVVPGSVSMPVPAIPAVPGLALPTSAVFVPTMPVSACRGPSICSLQHAIFPAPVAVAGCYDIQTSNAMDYKAYLTCQQLQPMNANMYSSLTTPHHPNQAERKCNTTGALLQ